MTNIQNGLLSSIEVSMSLEQGVLQHNPNSEVKQKSKTQTIMKQEKRKFSFSQSVKRGTTVIMTVMSVLLWSGCNKDELNNSEQVAKTSLNLEETGMETTQDSLSSSTARVPKLRAMDITQPSWIEEGNVDPNFAAMYTVHSPIKLSGNRYRFSVSSRHTARLEVYIKYFSPQGNIVYQKLTPNTQYTSYQIERTFQQEGRYYYRIFVVVPSTNRGKPLHSSGSSIAVELPLHIPPIENDYNKHVKIYHYASGSSDQWSFIPYNCTSWVALKVNQMWGTPTAFNNKMFGEKLGHAKYWKDILQAHGYLVDRNPKPGSIIWFPADAFNANRIRFSRENGHVAFVHKIENGKIIWTEYHGGNPTSYNEQNKYSLTDLPSSARFIHVQRKR